MTDYFDIAGSVNSLRDSLSPIDDPIDCCNYHYQILDKFCASMSAVSRQACLLIVFYEYLVTCRRN